MSDRRNDSSTLLTEPSRSGGLSAGALGTSHITFMVIAVAAPMAIVVATMPLAFAFGNGTGVAGTFLLAAAAMALFAIGYVRLIPHVTNAGAFYAIISASISPVLGLAAAYIALLCYTALTCSTLAAMSFFSADLLQRSLHVQVDWMVIALAVVAVVGLLSYFRITLTVSILAVALTAEVLIIVLLDVAILLQVDVRSVGLSPFSPSTVFAPGLGIAVIYAFNSCLGLESTAIYQEEARDRRRSIPRATYIAIATVGIFYALSAWALTAAAGDRGVAAMAAADPGHFVFAVARQYLGSAAEDGLALLVVTSTFAATLGLFNNATRYLFALARDGVVPGIFAWTHPVHRAPAAASLPLLLLILATMGAARAAQLDPLLSVTTSAAGVGSVGLMGLLGLTALAVPVYFLRKGGASFATIVPPLLGGVVILSSVVLSIENYTALTGTDDPVINQLPWVLLPIAAIGVGQALWLRSRSPSTFRRIGQHRVDAE